MEEIGAQIDEGTDGKFFVVPRDVVVVDEFFPLGGGVGIE